MCYAAVDLPEALVQNAQAVAQATQPSLNALYAWRWRLRAYLNRPACRYVI
jgi:hypothetical protein